MARFEDKPESHLPLAVRGCRQTIESRLPLCLLCALCVEIRLCVEPSVFHHRASLTQRTRRRHRGPQRTRVEEKTMVGRTPRDLSTPCRGERSVFAMRRFDELSANG